MRASVIHQYPGQAPTADSLCELLSDFSAGKKAQLRVLVAFASRSGFALLESSLRAFLNKGHRIFWIVGVDLGGTGREALEFLYELKRTYPKLVDARVFSTGDNQTIFHPKVYWLDADDRKVVVIGSANATAGGLANNFETSVQLALEPLIDEDVLEDLDFLWMSYSSPSPPLSKDNLLEIDRSLLTRFAHDAPPTDARPREPHPLRGLVRSAPRPRSTKAKPKSGRALSAHSAKPQTGNELIMDILEETRQTQVQLPVQSLDTFFKGVAGLHLRQIRKGKVVKVDLRPIIHLDNNTHRIEIDAIRGLPRPQIIRFRRGSGSRAIDYELLLKGTREHVEYDTLLATDGHQTRKGARRWLQR